MVCSMLARARDLVLRPVGGGLLVAALTGLSGCASLAPNQYEIRMDSIPSGALVYTERGKAIGITPLERIMVLSAENQARDSLTDGVIVVWPSGATSRQTVTIWPKKNRIWNVTFSRPPTAPGLDVDLRHANVQSHRAAAGDSDASSLLAAFAAGFAQRPPSSIDLSLPSRIRCTSRRSGWAVVTDCNER